MLDDDDDQDLLACKLDIELNRTALNHIEPAKNDAKTKSVVDCFINCDTSDMTSSLEMIDCVPYLLTFYHKSRLQYQHQIIKSNTW